MSPGFVHSQQLCRLLRYSVEQALHGHTGHLKETSIGMEVFDRGAAFDPGSDTIVRVEARRLRHKLEEYYRTEGRADPIEFVLTPGSYVPTFHARAGNGAPIAPQRSGIAVLPFWNLSGEPEIDRLCDALTEELISALACSHHLRVAARTSVFQFKGRATDVCQLAALLNVDTVIEGSIRRCGSRIRVTVQQICAADGCSLASVCLERELQDGFAFQEELTESICGGIVSAAAHLPL
jgi:serine/threonine-protein kinase